MFDRLRPTTYLLVATLVASTACAHGAAPAASQPASQAKAAADNHAKTMAAPAPTPAPETTDAALAACERLVQAYAVARDRVDVDAVASLFTADAEFVFQKARVTGLAAIAAMMQERAKGTITRHLMTTTDMKKVDDDTVEGISYFIVFSEPETKDLPMASDGPRAVIEYHDRFQRTDGEWKIERREVKLVFVPARPR